MIEWKQLTNLPTEESRNPKLFYYTLQDQPGRSYLICRYTIFNRIGFICSTADILGERDYITDVEFDELGLQENEALQETITYLLRYPPQNSYPEIVKCDDIISTCRSICGNFEIVYAVGLRDLGSVFVTNENYSNKNLMPNIVGTILYDGNYIIRGDICVLKNDPNEGLSGYTLEEAKLVIDSILNIYSEFKE